MSRKYKIYDDVHPYFVTFTVVDWICCFNYPDFCHIFIDSVHFCQKNKGLKVYAWCIMPNHIHMIIGKEGDFLLANIIRDLKAFTSRKFHETLKAGSNDLWNEIYLKMRNKGLGNNNNRQFQFWQQHNHPIELSTENLFFQKIEYINENPVKAGLVKVPGEYKYSSAFDKNETYLSRIKLSFHV